MEPPQLQLIGNPTAAEQAHPRFVQISAAHMLSLGATANVSVRGGGSSGGASPRVLALCQGGVLTKCAEVRERMRSALQEQQQHNKSSCS